MNDLYLKSDELQNEKEVEEFISILKTEGVKSYLEIGSKYGGSLWRIANSLPSGSHIASIDLPWGKQETRPHLISCINHLRELGYDAHLHLGDSTSESAIRFAESLAPFDCIFIDANHTEPFVRKDWANYSTLGKIIAFHDISWNRPITNGRLTIDVQKVWNELKQNYKHREIRYCQDNNGIGVIWR